MDSSKCSRIPQQYIWPEKDMVPAEGEVEEALIDLGGWFLKKSDDDQTFGSHNINLIRSSCLNHGFFQVINHGVDSEIIRLAHLHAKAFFNLPISEKQKGQNQPGCQWGFSLAHTSRFSAKLPWKQMLTFGFKHINNTYDDDAAVAQFFQSHFGNQFHATGLVFQEYCEAMKKLALALMEILGISLGVDGAYFKDFFEDGNAIMRANFYPTCPEPGLTLGVGPHFDPTSLTILHQDEVKGLEVFVDNKWRSIRPRKDAFVISLGDTFVGDGYDEVYYSHYKIYGIEYFHRNLLIGLQSIVTQRYTIYNKPYGLKCYMVKPHEGKAMSNGIYKSCLHRAVVNKYEERISLTYFLCPREDKVVKPPEDLISRERPRKYPQFTWLDFLHYTTNYYRADDTTLQNFTNWLLSSKPTSTSTSTSTSS